MEVTGIHSTRVIEFVDYVCTLQSTCVECANFYNLPFEAGKRRKRSSILKRLKDCLLSTTSWAFVFQKLIRLAWMSSLHSLLPLSSFAFASTGTGTSLSSRFALSASPKHGWLNLPAAWRDQIGHGREQLDCLKAMWSICWYATAKKALEQLCSVVLTSWSH